MAADSPLSQAWQQSVNRRAQQPAERRFRVSLPLPWPTHRAAPAGAAGGEQSPTASLTAQRAGGNRTPASTSTPAASNIAGGAATNLVAQASAATGGAPSRGAESQPSAPPTGAATGPQRATSAPFTANAQADDVQVASAPQPRGGREGSPLEASVAGASRQPSGLPGRTTTSPPAHCRRDGDRRTTF